MAPHKDRELKELKPEPLSELVYRALRDSIFRGEYEMGEKIVEGQVAKELGISRSPIREALRRLSDERLVDERPRHGAFVRVFEAVDFVDIYNLRTAVETASIRLTTRRQPSLKPIEETISEMGKAAKKGEIADVVKLEFTVHQQISDASGNEYLASTFRSLEGPIRMALALDDAAYQHLDDVVTEHQPLVDAIREGDELKAAAAVERHILTSVGPVLERLGGNAGDLMTTYTTG